MIVRERFSGRALAADATVTLTGKDLAGFLCTVSGTLDVDTAASGGTAVVDALPVTAGIYYPLPLHLPNSGCVLTLSGGAAGTLLA